MTNSELILRLVEMLLTEKENSMKVEQEKEKNKDQMYTIHSRNRVEVTVYPVFLEQQWADYIYFKF